MHPFHTKEHEIRWDTLTAEHIEKDADKALELADQRLQAIRDLSKGEVTFENTFVALEKSTEELEQVWTLVNHLDSVSNNEAQREALNHILPKVTSFFSSISLDDQIWSSLKAFAESEEVKDLSELEQRFISETCIDFIQSGADLEGDKKQQVAEVSAKLAEVTQKYSENTLDSTNAWELIVTDESRLSGVPEMFIEQARQDALAKGYGSEDAPQWRITLQQPSYFPFYKHADDESLRKEIWQGICTIGNTEAFDNTAKVWEILELRQRKAELLGKENFADVVLENRMAKSGQGALEFTHNLHAKVQPAFKKEHEELLAYKIQETGETDTELYPWDGAYWAEKLRKERYDFDEIELRPYFEVNNVMTGMFTIFSQLFGIRIEEMDDSVQTWHEECKYYRLYDAASEVHLGSFYADWHPRETKRGGAWMNSLYTGGPQPDGTHEPHIGLIVGNMTKPTGDKPALLDHREVETIFHEFGHLLHHLLGNVSIKSLAGTNVPWDFVELPSQILENWCWDRESLDLFAKHYETGEVIPDELYKKMVAAKNFRSASGFMGQLAYGKMDLEIHNHLAKYQGQDLDQLEEAILVDYKNKSSVQSPSMLRKFGHLFSSPTGYAAGYYSYKWAEVLDADAFTRFAKEGILNKLTGTLFRKEILAVGNSRPVDESYRIFMGRDPELEPLLVRAGIEA